MYCVVIEKPAKKKFFFLNHLSGTLNVPISKTKNRRRYLDGGEKPVVNRVLDVVPRPRQSVVTEKHCGRVLHVRLGA